MPPPVYILGDGPCAHVLAGILRAPRLGRRKDGVGWDWPRPPGRGKPPESLRLLLVVDPAVGAPQWIRRHAEARDCSSTLARRTGVLLFGMAPAMADELRGRDVFGRTGAQPEADQTFGTWGPDLQMLDCGASLRDLLAALATLESLPRSAWESARCRASCLPALLGVLGRRDAEALPTLMAELNQIDWDARCFAHPIFGDPHAWANRIRRWLGIVTAGVPPDWEEGLALFLPLESKTA